MKEKRLVLDDSETTKHCTCLSALAQYSNSSAKCPPPDYLGIYDKHKSNFLFVSNHCSYVDPVVVNCFVPTLPVAKSEVGDWPLIGFGAKITGILCVKRANKQSRADTRAGVRLALQKGFHVLIYPEGTTSDLPQSLPFRTGSFKTAVEVNKGIIPIAMSYGEKSDASIGADTFVPHFIRCFGLILLNYAKIGCQKFNTLQILCVIGIFTESKQTLV